MFFIVILHVLEKCLTICVIVVTRKNLSSSEDFQINKVKVDVITVHGILGLKYLVLKFYNHFVCLSDF